MMKRKRAMTRRPPKRRPPVRRRPVRRRPAAGRVAWRRAARGRFAWARSAWVRRGVLAVVLLAVVFIPVPGPAAGQPPASCHACRPQPANAERWASRLPGAWTAGTGATGTVPLSGQAYVAAGGGVAAVGDGLTVTAYALRDGHVLWQITLTAPAGSMIMSVRAWPGVVTAGVLRKGGQTRTEVVIDAATGTVLRQYPAAVFGGAVAASAATTVVVGRLGVTSYDNSDGRARWWRQTGVGRTWRADSDVLYVADSAGGYLGSAPVTGLRVINLDSGTERTLHAPPGHIFSGTLALAADGAVLFTSAAGVTAYSGSAGGTLWSMPAAVPEGTDPAARLVYLTSAGGALVGVDPLTGAVKASVSGSTAGGSAGMYVVRGGVALGIDSGAGGEAWGYNMAAGRVTWTAAGLPWPHFFADLSGLGGSAALSGSVVLLAVCPHLTHSPAPAATPTAPASDSTMSAPAASASATGRATGAPATTPSPAVTASPSATASPTASAAPVQVCGDPELVALNL